ncbi:unnamed protein product [Schistosoma mattheei]|uniref:Uncharacterized protein n=1 Tax=Schistosoma mattheei TaxID=31246 RepID=A0A183NXZ0_9TREM|nr:unnamed protein product [Schistosoma mattheei]
MKRSQPERPVKDKQGRLVVKIHEEKNKCAEHSEELLSRPASLNPLDIETTPTDLPIGVTSLMIEEIRTATKQADRPENIPAEALKSDIEAIANMLQVLYMKIWKEDHVPTNWKEGYLIKISK